MSKKFLLQALSLFILALNLGCRSTGGSAAGSPILPKTSDEVQFTESFGKAQNGDAEAQYLVGKSYSDGWGVARDLVEASKWLRKAAEQGHAKAQTSLGLAYVEGRGVAGNYEEAQRWFRKSAAQGNAEAQGLSLGFDYLFTLVEARDCAEAAQKLRASAEGGNATAQTFLGYTYFEGKGVTNNYAEAVKWFRQAAEQGNTLARALLGIAYYEGKGVARNYDEAFKWSRGAAEQGHALAQRTLGLCYQAGKGAHKNAAEAARWFRDSAEQGNEAAQFSLGLAYCRGRGVPRDYAQAYRWLDLAAAQGYWNAASAREQISRRMSPGQLAKAGAVPRCYLTRFDRHIIDAHEQRYNYSCIPSAVEMVLKLTRRVPGSYYEQQDAWKNKTDGSFRNFDGKTIEGVTFHQRFTEPHTGEFPLAELFQAIDAELRAGRFVIVGIDCTGGTHEWVIYDEDTEGDFLAVSKAGAQTLEDKHVRKAISRMRSTDLGTYEFGTGATPTTPASRANH